MPSVPASRDFEPASAYGGGLSSIEAAARLRRDGPNLLPQPERRSGWRILRDLLKEPMLLLLIAATVVYLLLGDPHETALLAASVLLVMGLTYRNEHKSEAALQALRDLGSPPARVERDGRVRLIPARELVIGDRIHVSEGDRVPADARVVEATALCADESLLSGESVPVPLDASAGGPVRRMLHASTLVVSGHGIADVVAVGGHTAVGRIGAALATIKLDPTPMQREIRRMAVAFAVLGIAACVLVAAVYAATRGGWLNALLAGLTLAMAMIPEEFPVVLTVFLALGAWRMARRNALVRRTPAIEALGAITVLCADKTGTLTENRMTVADWNLAGSRSPDFGKSERLLATATRASRTDSYDPMELALRAAATPAGQSEWVHLREYPLSAAHPAVTHVWRSPQNGSLPVACKGAPEAVVRLCRLHGPAREQALEAAASMARRGLRVLGVAAASWPDAEIPSLPAAADGFVYQWLGLIGFADPLRAGVREAVADAHAAGVRLIMLTGDHVDTARAVARDAGLADEDDGVITGADLDRLDDLELGRRLATTTVFARVRPEHKLRLVNMLKRAQNVVAMTGDGVNDAPALLAAHAGIAMGGRGTDVAREAASIVLLDDNFVTIVEAIRMGRRIYDNIRRAIRYVIAVHVPIVGLAFLPLLIGSPLLLLPLQVVLVELIIDPTCAVVFEREAPAPDLMRRPPRRADEHLVGIRGLLASLAQGGVMFAAVVFAYAIGVAQGLPTPQLAALTFTALVAGNLGLIVVYRPGHSLWQTLRQPNAAFAVVIGVVPILLLVVTQVGAVSGWFGFSPPPFADWLVVAAIPVLAAAVMKALSGQFRRSGGGTGQYRSVPEV